MVISNESNLRELLTIARELSQCHIEIVAVGARLNGGGVPAGAFVHPDIAIEDA